MLRLHDTMAGEKRDFVPLNSSAVTVYQCGPTVYDSPHLGNARPAVVFDVLFRVLQHRYGLHSVRFVRNYTDIDDKIIARAEELGESIDHLTKSVIHTYEVFMKHLNVREPLRTPRATDYVDQMQMIIGDLIESGHAYVADGHVLFSIASHADHGKLSKQNLEGLRAGARVEIAPYKRDSADFVLWKPAKPGEPFWPSPWGDGRPGWHIECSAMISAVLGVKTLDIHVGGSDLIFPHHENEIAQSECWTHAPLANYWLHNGMLTIDGKKMSKSEGNFIRLDDFFDMREVPEVKGEVLRYLLLGTHYRQTIDFTHEKLRNARTALDGLYTAVLNPAGIGGPPEPDLAVLEALEDDLNTPAALAALHGLAKRVNLGQATVDSLLASGKLLGLLEIDPRVWQRGVISGDHVLLVNELIEGRRIARENKDWETADKLRSRLDEMNIILEDTPSGTTWRQKGAST